MIPSPIKMNQKTKELAFHTRMMADLLKVHDKFLSKIEELSSLLSEAITERKRIIELPEGKKGERGEVGPAGPQGEPGIGVNGRDGKDGVSPDPLRVAQIATALITKPKDGTAPELNTIVEAVIEALKEKDSLGIGEKLEGISNEITSYRQQMAWKQAGQHGGGTTVSAGSNITLVPQADGTVEINASGGGSGTNVATQYQLTAVAAGADATIALSQLTNFATFSDLIAVYQNNVMLTEGLNFTLAGSTVTVINGTDSDIYNVTYSYA